MLTGEVERCRCRCIHRAQRIITLLCVQYIHTGGCTYYCAPFFFLLCKTYSPNASISAETAHGLPATMDALGSSDGVAALSGSSGRLKRGLLLLERVRKPNESRVHLQHSPLVSRRSSPAGPKLVGFVCRAGSLPCSLLEAARGAAGRHLQPSETVRAPLRDPDRLLRRSRDASWPAARPG